MRNGHIIDPEIAEVMAEEISRHRKKSVPTLVDGQLDSRIVGNSSLI